MPLPPHLGQPDIVRGRVELDHLDVPVETLDRRARRAHHGPGAEPGELLGHRLAGTHQRRETGLGGARGKLLR
ncbi:MAG TPA: hypothetical protein VK122_06725 [Brachybacterium sp.]|nr:hypothetical protein [Brachybacterium sp.]